MWRENDALCAKAILKEFTELENSYYFYAFVRNVITITLHENASYLQRDKNIY